VLVQENIRETVEAKTAIFAQLDALTPPDAVLASSTSWLPASTFTADLPGRGRCLVGHPTNPPYLVPLVELCPAPWTDPKVMERAHALYAGAGQTPVSLSREIPGFLLNRVQAAVLNECFTLFEQGLASAEDIDKVLKDGLALRWSFMGPFETIDLNAPAGVTDYAKRYGPQRVEAACTLALELGAGQYRHVRDILTNGRDLIERAAPAPEWVSPEHDNLRGASYFH